MATTAARPAAPAALETTTLCQAFQVTAAERPDQVALRTPGDGVAITYREYAERVRAIAGGLASLGVGRGDTVALMVDANQAMTAPDAIRLGEAMADRNISWFEEPLPAHDIVHLAEVAAALDMPIASGENEYTRYGFRRMIEARAARTCPSPGATASARCTKPAAASTSSSASEASRRKAAPKAGEDSAPAPATPRSTAAWPGPAATARRAGNRPARRRPLTPAILPRRQARRDRRGRAGERKPWTCLGR